MAYEYNVREQKEPPKKNYAFRTIIFLFILLVMAALVGIFLYYFFVINPMGIGSLG